MSSNDPVNPGGVPVFTGDAAVLEAKVKALSGDGARIASAAGEVHSTFGGLRAFYKAPEAEQLFATTRPVVTTATAVSSEVSVIAGALGTYASDIRPLVARLNQLRQDAADFRAKVDGDDEWNEDGDLVDENLSRRNEIAEVWAAFQEAERACHAKIVALVGGDALKADDGSNKKNTYGYDAEALKQAESLPWGDAVQESTRWYHGLEHLEDFATGFVVDGLGGTLAGLGTLVGIDGWDAAKQAWTGLAKLATGVALLTTPLAGIYLATPDDMLPSWLRESRTALKETGKALVAWDQWGEQPGRAAGAATFNVLTTVFTYGAGGAISGAGKAGAAAKTISLAGKAGRAVDPMTYVFKGAGAGLAKIGDVMAGLKGMGNFEIPRINEGAFSLPDGSRILPDGTIQLPKGTAIPEGATRLPDGNAKLPEGTVTLPPGTVRLPADGPPQYLDPAGNLYNSAGDITQRAEDAKPDVVDNPKTDTPPKVEAPAKAEIREPAAVGARAGDDATRVNTDISAPASVGDNLPGNRPDTTPGGTADNTPRNSVDTSGTDAGRTQTPSTARTDGPGTSGTHIDGPGTGSGHNLPGGSSADNGFRSGHSTADHTAPGVGGHADDATGAGRNANHEEQLVDRSPEEAKRIQDEHVRLANEDPAWLKEHYDARLHRRTAEEIVDGQYLPILKDVGNGKYVSSSDLPYGPGEKYRLQPQDPKLDNIPADRADKLDGLAGKHKAYTDLGTAERAHKENPTRESAAALQAAKETFGDTPVNTKVGEALGEGSARLHVIPEIFPGAREVTDLPSTPNGSRCFDQLYELESGEFLIAEAKAPDGRLAWRQGAGVDAGRQVRQGTLEYVQTIVTEMYSRGGRDRQIAEQLRIAIMDEKVQYVMVQAKHHTGTYAGGELRYFKIFEDES